MNYMGPLNQSLECDALKIISSVLTIALCSPKTKMGPEKGTMYITVHLVHRAYGEFQACFVGAKTEAFRMADSYIPVRRLTLSLSARLLALPSCMLPHDEENGLMMGSGPAEPVVCKFAREGKP